jgi:hypothetical protein
MHERKEKREISIGYAGVLVALGVCLDGELVWLGCCENTYSKEGGEEYCVGEVHLDGLRRVCKRFACLQWISRLMKWEKECG